MSPKNPARMSPQPGVGVSGVLDWIALITLSELGERINSMLRTMFIQGIEVITSIATTLAIGMIVYGVALYALRQEFVGIRWIVGGIVILVAFHIVIPFLLSLV
jgi:hypothetical protein